MHVLIKFYRENLLFASPLGAFLHFNVLSFSRIAASRFGRVLDSRVKSARWVSELGMVFGVGLEMMTPLVPVWLFLPLASVANTLKGLSALSGVTNAKKSFVILSLSFFV